MSDAPEDAADAPTAAPSRWRSLISLVGRIGKRTVANDLHNHAAEMAYFGMMAVFPFFLLLTTLIPFLNVPDLFGETMRLLREFAPVRIVDLLEDVVREVTTVRREGLFSATLVTCLWMSLGAMGSTTRGMNKAFGLKDPRAYGRFLLLTLIMTLLLGVLLVTAITLVLLGPALQTAILQIVPLGSFGPPLLLAFRWGVILLTLFAFLGGLYWLCPAIKRRFRLFTPGTLFVGAAWILVGQGLRIYLAHVQSYDRIFGSLGTVIILLFWFYVMALLLLIGAQIDAEVHPEYKARLDTEGRPLHEPFNWRLALVAFLVVVAVPLSIKFALPEDSFDQGLAPVAASLEASLKTGIEEGTDALDFTSLKAPLADIVDAEGRIDREALTTHLPVLRAFLRQHAELNPATVRREDLLALGLNLHLVQTLVLVGEHPAWGHVPRTHESGHEQARAELAGEKLSLHTLRDGILRPLFGDPRVLFVLSDASESGPPLPRGPFEAATIEATLEQAVAAMLAPPRTTVEAGGLVLPAFLEGLRHDFDEASGGLSGFVIARMAPELQEALGPEDQRPAPRFHLSDTRVCVRR